MTLNNVTNQERQTSPRPNRSGAQPHGQALFSQRSPARLSQPPLAHIILDKSQLSRNVSVRSASSRASNDSGYQSDYRLSGQYTGPRGTDSPSRSRFRESLTSDTYLSAVCEVSALPQVTDDPDDQPGSAATEDPINIKNDLPIDSNKLSAPGKRIVGVKSSPDVGRGHAEQHQSHECNGNAASETTITSSPCLGIPIRVVVRSKSEEPPLQLRTSPKQVSSLRRRPAVRMDVSLRRRFKDPSGDEGDHSSSSAVSTPQYTPESQSPYSAESESLIQDESGPDQSVDYIPSDDYEGGAAIESISEAVDSGSNIMQSEEYPDKVLALVWQHVRQLLAHSLLRYAAHGETDGADGCRSSSKRTREASSSSPDPPSKRKQPRGRGRDPNDPDDDDSDSDGDNSDRPKKGIGRLPNEKSMRRLKCPFYQRDPEQHSHRASCRGPGFEDMARLKDHIKRVHTQPQRCARCWTDMESEEAYEVHLQEEPGCQLRPRPHDDRVQPRIIQRVNFKKSPYKKANSPGEKWKIFYKVLFPETHEKDIPSPYETHGLDSKLERLLFEALEEELMKYFGPISEDIKRRIPLIVDGCKAKLQQSSTRDKADDAPSPSQTARNHDTVIETTAGVPSTAAHKVPVSIMSVDPMQHSSKAKGKQPRPRGMHVSPAGSSMESLTTSRHTSSPGSVFDAVPPPLPPPPPPPPPPRPHTPEMVSLRHDGLDISYQHLRQNSIATGPAQPYHGSPSSAYQFNSFGSADSINNYQQFMDTSDVPMPFSFSTVPNGSNPFTSADPFLFAIEEEWENDYSGGMEQ